MAEWWQPFLDAWNRHDGAGVAAFMAEDGSYEDVALGAKHTGRADIAAWIDGMAGELSSDYRLDPVSFVQNGDAYAGEWVLTGTQDGSGGALPGTGKRFSIRGVSIGVLENGKVKQNIDYWDMAGFLVQIGLMPAPEGVG